MKIGLCFLVPLAAFAADSDAVQRLFDGKLTPLKRANACLELRGQADTEVIAALRRAMEDPDLLPCAADNLQRVGAIELLKQALSSQKVQVRAVAARELGTFQKPELIEALAQAAQDGNLLVATNALSGLSQYQDAAVIPYLRAISRKGGITGDMALDRLWQLDADAALKVARGLLSSAQVPDLLYAMRIIGASGDSSDLPQLNKIAAANPETLTQRSRGFGFMPAINLSRAAQSAIAAIQSRLK
jgi:HEAT repeat protein